MMKKILGFVLTMIMVWCAVGGTAAATEGEEADLIVGDEIVPFAEGDIEILASGECGENVSYVLIEDGTLTFSGTGEMNFIARNNLENDLIDSVKKVVIEEGIINVSYAAFSGCSNLQEIDIPKNVTEIGVSAFYDTPWAKSVMEKNNGYLVVNNILLEYDGTDTELQIPENVTKINPAAFQFRTKITSVKMSDQVVSIGQQAFQGCDNLKKITFSKNLTKIGYIAFAECTSLSEVEIPENVTTIERGAFQNTALTSITIPQSVITIEPYAIGYTYGYNEEIGAVGPAEVKDFTIYGYKSTEAERYAKSGETFVFVALDGGDTPLPPEESRLKIVAEKTDEVYVIGSGKDAVIYCTGELNEFVSVEVDGLFVSPENYILEEGSTVLTFSSAYLDTLSVGVHKVKLNYIDDSITTTLTIIQKNSNIPTDNDNANGQQISSNGTVQTGDASNIILWMSVAVFAMAVGSSIVIRKKICK